MMVPPFFLGIGDFTKLPHNNFVKISGYAPNISVKIFGHTLAELRFCLFARSKIAVTIFTLTNRFRFISNHRK